MLDYLSVSPAKLAWIAPHAVIAKYVQAGAWRDTSKKYYHYIINVGIIFIKKTFGWSSLLSGKGHATEEGPMHI